MKSSRRLDRKRENRYLRTERQYLVYCAGQPWWTPEAMSDHWGMPELYDWAIGIRIPRRYRGIMGPLRKELE